MINLVALAIIVLVDEVCDSSRQEWLKLGLHRKVPSDFSGDQLVQNAENVGEGHQGQNVAIMVVTIQTCAFDQLLEDRKGILIVVDYFLNSLGFETDVLEEAACVLDCNFGELVRLLGACSEVPQNPLGQIVPALKHYLMTLP